MRTTYSVTGTLRGPIWWPVGAPAEKAFEYRAIERPGSLRELAESIMAAEGGDFSGAPLLLADTALEITRWRSDGRGHRSRLFDLASFASLEGYTSPEYPEWDGAE